MRQVQESISINADKTTVFNAYVNHIDRWWPRRGSYRYSFAGAEQKPATIKFEPAIGGRFLETFDDGSEYEIGRITTYTPPDHLNYTWRDPRWTNYTTVDVTFHEANGVTTVTVCHSGFGANGVPPVGDGYKQGLAEILSAFAQSFLA